MCARAPDGVADGLGDAATGLPQGRGGSTSCSCDSGPAGGHPPAKNLGMLGVPPLERQRQARVRARQPSPSSDAGAQRAKAPRAKTASTGRTRSCDTLSSLRVPPRASAAPTWGVETRRRLIGGIRRRRCDRLRAEDELGCTQRWQTRVVDRYPQRDQDPRLNSAIAVSTDRNGALPCQPSGALPPRYELDGSRLLPILASVEHQELTPSGYFDSDDVVRAAGGRRCDIPPPDA